METMKRKNREETNCRNTRSHDGTFTPHIGKTTAERLTRYCKDTDQNRTKFVEKCINERLDVLEMDFLNGMSKEQLIEMLLKR